MTESPAHLRKFQDPESGLALIKPALSSVGRACAWLRDYVSIPVREQVEVASLRVQPGPCRPAFRLPNGREPRASPKEPRRRLQAFLAQSKYISTASL